MHTYFPHECVLSACRTRVQRVFKAHASGRTNAHLLTGLLLHAPQPQTVLDVGAVSCSFS